MLLKIYGSNSNRIIKLHPQFFTTQVEKRMGKTIKITPFKKALDLSKDLLGKNYRGHILEENGVVIENVLENRDAFAGSNGITPKDFNANLTKKMTKAFE